MKMHDMLKNIKGSASKNSPNASNTKLNKTQILELNKEYSSLTDSSKSPAGFEN